jgi:hypothetical protein
MPRPDDAGAARDKANQGQDEKTHTFVNDAGETVTGTMRDFHTTLRDQGYRPQDDAAEADAEAGETPADPAAPSAG